MKYFFTVWWKLNTSRVSTGSAAGAVSAAAMVSQPWNPPQRYRLEGNAVRNQLSGCFFLCSHSCRRCEHHEPCNGEEGKQILHVNQLMNEI